MKAFCGYINDEKLLKKCASGGFATAMYQTVLGNGGVVYGVAYTKNFKSAEFCRVTNESELSNLRSSKYVKATLTKEILDNIVKDLNSGITVLFIGLPCDVGAVRNYITKKQIKDTDLYLVELICHGPTITPVLEQYIDNLEKKFKSKVKAFNVRYKNPYWLPMNVFAEFENGKKYVKPFYQTEYGIAFSNLSRESCYNCKYKNNNHKGDLSIGDYWGIKECDKGYNKFGTSVAICQTFKGESFLTSLNNILLYDADLDRVLAGNPRYLEAKQKLYESIQFQKIFESHGIKRATFKYLNPVCRIKDKIYSIIKRKNNF